MIVEQVAAGGNTRTVSIQERSQLRPAIAGRELLGRLLDQSILVRLMLALTLIAVACLIYLAQASQMSVLESQIGALRTDNVSLMARNANLHAQANDLQSMQRIDTEATTKLHMTKPDLATTVWIRPVVPRVVPIVADSLDNSAAKRQSQPLAWLDRFVTFVQNSL